MQLVAARAVAEELAALAVEPRADSTGIPEIAGPREESLVDVAVLFASKQADPFRIEAVSNPDDPNREIFECGALLPGPNATLAGPTFEEWLEAQVMSHR
jgi:hypothetical protein